MTGFREVLDRYGQGVTVCYGDGRPERVARAILQPVEEEQAQELPTPLGVVRRDRFLYFGEPEVSPEGCDCLKWNGRTLFLRNVQPIYIGETLSHWRAVVGMEGEV